MSISDGWHRRQAVAIASTLPEDTKDARTILLLALELLDGFLSEGAPKGLADSPAFQLQRAVS